MAALGGYRTSALDIRRLSLFLAVVEHDGFTRAAQAVHISQPALSQAVAELEAELGGPLFHRLGRAVTLTEAGAALVGPARSVLREIDAARQVTAEVNQLSRGRLDLSALPTLSTDPLPALLGAYRQAHPAVTVHIASPGDPDELAEQVRVGVAEVGVTDASRAADGLETVPFRGQQLVAVFPPGTAEMAGPLRPGSLAGVPLIVTPPGSSGRPAARGRPGPGRTAPPSRDRDEPAGGGPAARPGRRGGGGDARSDRRPRRRAGGGHRGLRAAADPGPGDRAPPGPADPGGSRVPRGGRPPRHHLAG